MARQPDPGFVQFDMPRAAGEFWALLRRVDEYVNVDARSPSDKALAEAWMEFRAVAHAHLMSKATQLPDVPPDGDDGDGGVVPLWPRAQR